MTASARLGMALLHAHALCLAACLLSAAELRVEAVVPWTSADGCTPVLAEIDGSFLREDAQVELSARGESRRNQPGYGATLTVTARAGRTVRAWLLLPNDTAGHRAQASVRLSWRSPAGSDETSAYAQVGHQECDLFVVDPGEHINLSDLQQTVSDAIGTPPNWAIRSGSGYDKDRVKRLSPEHLPDRWQGLPGWSAILLGRSALAQTTPAQRAALATWVRAGGRLYAVAEAAPAWRAAGVPALGADEAGSAVAAAVKAGVDRVGREVDRVEVPGQSGVPTWLFVTVSVVFAIIVGPLNLWWVARRGSMAWFLATTPLISAGGCVLLIVAGVVSEGLEVRRTMVQVVHLDQQARAAVGWTAASWFAGVAPAMPALGGDDLVVSHHGAGDRTAVWSAAGLDPQGSWIGGRAHAQTTVIQAAAEPRRVRIERDGGGWRLSNGLGAAIAQGMWRAPDGTMWQAGPVPDGAAVALRPGSHAIEPPTGRTVDGARRAWDAAADAPGGFLALLSSPFLPPAGPDGVDAMPVSAYLCTVVAPERR